MTETAPPPNRWRQARILAWILVAIAAVGIAGLWVVVSRQSKVNDATPTLTVSSGQSYGGPFTLVGADGKPFSSIRLAGKPYAIYFGYTRCGDVCPTTLARLVKLRKQSGGEDALNIVFITIDPAHDGPKEVGQYASLFNSPIVGLTGSKAQIERVKAQYHVYAQPEPMTSGHDMRIDHTAAVLLFDRNGKMSGTISVDEQDGPALAKLKQVTA